MAFKANVQKLTPRHYKILDYCVAGLTTQQIAAKLCMTRTQVGIVISSPSFQHQFGLRRAQLEEIQADVEVAHIDEVRDTLQKSAKDAADKLINCMSSDNENIKLKSATEILDRTGYPKEQKMSGDAGNKTQIIVSKLDMLNLTESLKLDSSAIINPAQDVI